MNILLFDAAKYWSGGAQRVYLCCRGFKEKKHNVFLICLPTSRLNILLKNKIEVFNIHPVFDLDLLAAIKIFYILIKYKIEVLDIHSPKFYWLGLFASKILRKKVFITRNVEYRKKGLKKVINRFLYNNLTGVIAVSKKIKEALISDFKIDESKIKTIYDGFIIQKSKARNIRGLYDVKEEEIVLSIIARIERNKGQDLAIDILNELIRNGYESRLFIIGKKEDEIFYNELIKKIENLNLKNQVIFTDFVENVSDYIYSSDVILCCSYYEGLPRSVIESLIFLKPVVSTAAIDFEELFDFKDLIKIIRDRDPKKFAEAILGFVFDKKQKIYDEKLFEKFSYSSMVEKYLEFYKRK